MTRLIFLISGFGCVDDDMGEEEDQNAPVDAEDKSKRDAVQDTVNEQDVPVSAFIGSEVIALKEIVADGVAHDDFDENSEYV